jgi:hypothetical protein
VIRRRQGSTAAPLLTPIGRPEPTRWDNARASTGPRTQAGKARSARNARRHGLSVAIARDPTFAEEAEALARRLVGDGAARTALALARAFAVAQIDLDRVRKVRRDVAARLIADSSDDDPANENLGGDEVDRSELMGQLRRLERYERRAQARRKRAIRAFDRTFAEAMRRHALEGPSEFKRQP